ncbi:Tyrocidine synthase 1 [Planctomycetes bacterium Poly30]|uniref:Tyrocidine synthase 1 n=1 Tax=Saltatorellus ferox TaxID=2528018 RepID=A0A518F1B5_9BACT|nr:Tyrocidine synthase 1 [Planctomycetes bacterium Poly30]
MLMHTGFLIHSAVEAWARETPDAPAMVFGGETQTYAELLAASQRLAAALLENGLQRSDRVGVFLRKGLDLGPAIYGALLAGGAFVPLDPAVPVERLEFMLRDGGIRHVVTSGAMRPTLARLAERMGDTTEAPILYGVDSVDGMVTVSSAEIAARDARDPGVWITDQDLAYLMYTSGSTGEPKAMMHSHRGSLSYARWGLQHVRLTPEDRVASHAPLHFDLSIFDFFSTAQAGGAVVLVPEAVTKFPASWTELVEKERISVVFTVPFTLIEMLERGALDQRDLSGLRWVLFGGEPFPPKHLRALMERLPHVRFTNVYGPAEAPSCTCHDVEPIAEGDDTPISIGTVSVGSDDLILDESDEPITDGAPGELCIRSTTLTLGYWNRPDLNERVFHRRPSFGPFPDVYFRTGDLVQRGEDGRLSFLGRKDRMIKTRGHRVELDEVESALASHPAVQEAAAYTEADGVGSRSILAAVTLANPDDAAITPATLRHHARAKLPPYAVPREIAIVAEFPRTTSGKIDRRALETDVPTP